MSERRYLWFERPTMFVCPVFAIVNVVLYVIAHNIVNLLVLILVVPAGIYVALQIPHTAKLRAENDRAYARLKAYRV